MGQSLSDVARPPSKEEITAELVMSPGTIVFQFQTRRRLTLTLSELDRPRSSLASVSNH